MKNIIKRFIPACARPLIYRIYWSLVDTYDLLLKRRDELTPPKRLAFAVGGRDFKKIGEEFLQYFIYLGKLKPDEKVLDVGCGIGRMAIPLTNYLNSEGCYQGFDIVANFIKWCKENISPKYPNFHFQLADIYNKSYNPKGKYKASNYKFPYRSESFDFTFATSVFTHMLPQDMENYFSEISRTLRRGGRSLITFFLLNAESLKFIDVKLSTLDFKHDYVNYRTTDKNVPESAIAYDERFIQRLYEKYGLSIVEPIHYGSWCGRKKYLSYQDIVIAIKNKF